MKILHTEASLGWGGQEIRILKESLGMQKRGHEITFAVQKGAILGLKAKEKGFTVYEVNFSKKALMITLTKLFKIFCRHKIQVINTHSSSDAWVGGVAAKLAKIFIIRTRHLSTPIKKGLNSKLLYNFLADFVVTTCEETRRMIQTQAGLEEERLSSIPTGIDQTLISADPSKVEEFRKSLGLKQEDILIGTLCVLRGWKGIYDLLHAAKQLEKESHLKWVIVGGGVSEEYFKGVWKELGLERSVFFTGHLDAPYTALGAMDMFLLLSWANEGVSQSTLQAAWLKKPLITTGVGGLSEICVDGVTGLQVAPHSSLMVADAVLKLAKDEELRTRMGESAHAQVVKHFTFEQMLDNMEKVYCRLGNESLP